MDEPTLLPAGRWAVFATFAASLGVFTAIGALAVRRSRSTSGDYLLAGRQVPPWLVALSAVSTLSSGFMFIGQIGLTYRVGLVSMWWLIGWAVGDLLAWLLVHPRLRRLSEEGGKISPLSLLEPAGAGQRRLLVPLAGAVSVFYLAMYAAAQLKAGSVALQSIFGLPAHTGALVGAGIVVVYCYAGGLRASIWTDGAQSLVMFFSMALLTAVALLQVGGPESLMERLALIDPSLTRPLPEDPRLGFGVYLLGMIFGGFGVVGQPHILVRSMAIDDPRRIRTARLYYFAWLLPFYVMAILVGLCARVLMPELIDGAAEATEQALPLLSIALLPDVLIGLMLAGLFSATMSTADSQIIACTSAVTQDIQPSWSGSFRGSKLTTLGVTAVAFGIAVGSPAGVFDLVLDAWAVLSCTIGPLLLVRLFGLPLTQRMGVAMIATGFCISHLWMASGYASASYVNFPGMASAFAAYAAMLAARRIRARTRPRGV